jgi:hypothetical protein
MEVVSQNYLDSFSSALFCIYLSDVGSYITSYSKTEKNKSGKRGVGVAQYSDQVMGWMIWAVATDCFPQGCEADHSLSSSAEFKMSSAMPVLSLCAMYKDIFMGLGTGKNHVDICYKMGVFMRILLQFSSHFLF